jgi:hypothetical protein
MEDNLHGYRYPVTPTYRNYGIAAKGLLTLILTLTLISCIHLPFLDGKTDKPSGADRKTDKADSGESAKKMDMGEKVEADPKPGDIQVLDGIEYIYTRNNKFMLTPYEPEYVWIRKDQYVPGVEEQVKTALSNDKGRAELEARLAKLEEEYKKIGIPPQMGYPAQMTSLPAGPPGVAPSLPALPVTPSWPTTKRRVLVLPVEDRTNYRKEHLGELATRRLVSRLENTNAVICIDPAMVNLKGKATDPNTMKVLNEVYGVQAVLRGTLSDVYTSTSKTRGKEGEGETSFAVSNLIVEVYNTETVTLLKQLSGRNSVVLSRENGEMNSEKSRIKSVDLSIEAITGELLRAVLTIEWHARIASIESDRVYVNAGRLSGLEKGATLEVYGSGEQVLDSKTNIPLGKIKGRYKGRIQVAELFGVDASWTTPVKGGGFSPSDLVYLK